MVLAVPIVVVIPIYMLFKYPRKFRAKVRRLCAKDDVPWYCEEGGVFWDILLGNCAKVNAAMAPWLR